MKKHIIFVVVLAMLLSVITGCSTEQNGGSSKEPNMGEEDLELTIASGVVGSSWNVIATTIAGLIEENIEGSRITVIPGGGAPNIVAASQGEADLGISYNNIAWMAEEGIELFDEKIQMNAVAGFMTYALHVIVSDKLEVDSWEEIIENKYPLRLGVGSRGATGDLTLQAVLKEYGISYADILEWGGTIEYLSYPDTISLIRDNRLDGMTGFPDIPSSYIIEAVEAKSMKFLSIDDDIAQKAVENSGYVNYTIDAGTYKNQDYDVSTLGANMILFARPDLSEELVYKIVSILHDNQKRLISSVASMEKFKLESAWQNTGVPLHPGSERYYKEKGVLK